MKVYVSLPITGYPDGNEAMAREAAEAVRQAGHEPIVPHDIPPREHAGECPERRTYPGVTFGGHAGLCHLRADLIAMLDCDAIVLCPGWARSRGARVEADVARRVGIPRHLYLSSQGISPAIDPVLAGR